MLIKRDKPESNVFALKAKATSTEISLGVTPTMTSLELVAFINADRKERAEEAGLEFPCKQHAKLLHKSFLTKVPEVLGEGGMQKFLHTYTNEQNGQEYPCYRFPKREACLMAMSYSAHIRAKVYDRMTALEQKQAMGRFEIPTTLSGALLLASQQAATIEEQKEELKLLGYEKERELAEHEEFVEEMTPKVALLNKLLATGDVEPLQLVGQVLGVKPSLFFDWLYERKILQKHLRTPFQRYIDLGYFTVSYTQFEVCGEIRNNGRSWVTGKGVEWLDKQLSKHGRHILLANARPKKQ